MSHDPHFGYIFAAYAVALVIVASMVLSTVTDYIKLKRALALLEKTEPAPQDEMSRGPEAGQ